MMTTPFSIKTDGSPLERSLRTKEGHGSQSRPIRVDNQGVQRSMGTHAQLTSDLTIREGPTDLYDASNTLGDCAVAPNRSAPISAPWSNAVAATPLPTGTATVAPSTPVIFFQPDFESPKEEVRQHTHQDMVMPPFIGADFIVVHPYLGFALFKTLRNRPAPPAHPHK